jgi:hypothetical protein
MGAADEILSQIPLAQLADQLGLDEVSTEQAVRQAVPALLDGMQANAQDPMGAASLEKALGEHSGDPFEGLDLDQVDSADGEKIVGNIFGDNSQEVVNRLGGQTSGGGIMSKLLPILAPLVLSWLAGKFTGGGKAQSAPAGGGGGGLDDLLGGAADSASGGGLGDLLGGGGSGGGIGDLLGGLLGGGGDTGGGSDAIGDLLGGLLGGGKKG